MSDKRAAIIQRIGDLAQRADANSEPQCGRVVFLGKAEADALFYGSPHPAGSHVFGCEIRVSPGVDGIILEVPPPPPPPPRRYA